MTDLFTTRVRAAAVAGWWTVLIAVGMAVLQWIAYRHILSAHPEWVQCMLGRGMEWAEVQRTLLRAFITFRIFVAMLLLVVIWLTLWARQLKKRVAA
jgi:lysylphosphatidylglycerol synthetase-like protein (DUF2156 family)